LICIGTVPQNKGTLQKIGNGRGGENGWENGRGVKEGKGDKGIKRIVAYGTQGLEGVDLL